MRFFFCSVLFISPKYYLFLYIFYLHIVSEEKERDRRCVGVCVCPCVCVCVCRERPSISIIRQLLLAIYISTLCVVAFEELSASSSARHICRCSNALKRFREDQKRGPTLSHYYYFLGLAYHELGDHARELETARAEMRATPNESHSHTKELVALAALGELYTYLHHGFWKSMDTSKDQQEMERLAESGATPWTS